MKYDVFISYRREGGFDTAKHLNDLLVRDGYIVSFDIDTLRNGDFDVQLLKRIEQCKDFILIVDMHAFDRTLDPSFDPNKDWLRCELAHALKHKKNIIPVFLAGISSFPDNLPEDIIGVSKKNGPEYNKYYFDDFYQTLCSRFLTSRSFKKKIVRSILLLISIVLVFLIFMRSMGPKDISYLDPMIPQTTSEIEINNFSLDRLNNISDSLGFTNPSAALDYWLENKDSENNLNVGLCYIVGYGCTRDYTKATEYILDAANDGIAIAQYLLGACYDNGIGLKQDIEQATFWYKKAAENGVPEAQCDYAIACTSDNNMHDAFKWLSQSAEQGNAKAQYTFGWAYGQNNNINNAIYWIEKAAEQDYTMAKIALGNMYIQGPPAVHDYESAVEIFEDLSKENNPMAQYALAFCYAQNKGVDTDFNKAIEYLNKSAEQGFAPALVELAGVYCSGLPDLNISQDFDKALSLYKKAAEQGFPMAQLMLGRMYENGWGVRKNIKKSKEWYKKAERQGLNMQLIQQQQYQQLQQQYQNL